MSIKLLQFVAHKVNALQLNPKCNSLFKLISHSAEVASGSPLQFRSRFHSCVNSDTNYAAY